jgi:hypothetical protein
MVPGDHSLEDAKGRLGTLDHEVQNRRVALRTMGVVAGLLTREADRHMALTVLKAEGDWVPKSLCLAAEEHTGRLPFRCHDSRTFLLEERRGKCVCL